MSSPLPSAQITSPLQLVRPLSEEASDDSHVSKTPTTLSQAITPSRPALHYSRANSFSSTSTSIPSPSTSRSTSAELLPQLSERDSIFATHYLLTESTATTPRLQPTQRGKHNLHQDVAANLELSKPSSPSASKPPLLSYKTRSSSSIASLASNAPSPYWPTALTSASTSIPTSLNEPFVLPGHKVDASHNREIGGPSPATNSHPSSQYSRTKSYGALSYLRMSEIWNPPLATDRKKTKEDEENTGTRTEKIASDRRKRSSSRDTIEGGIEATLANEELVSSARSRKASHYLRLFKENTDTQEQKKGKDKLRDVPRHDKSTDATKSNLIIRGPNVDDDGDFNIETTVSDESRILLGEVGFDDNGRATEQKSQIEIIELKQNLRGTAVGKGSVGSRSEILRHFSFDEEKPLHRSPLEEQNVEWRSSSLSEHGIPFSLLEEIRNHPRKPTLPTDNRNLYNNTLKRDSGWLDAKTFTEDDKLEPMDNELRSEGKLANQDGEEYESNKEHISSAVYYPHQAASPDSSDTNYEQTEYSDDIDDAIRQPNFRSSELDTVPEEVQLPIDEGTIALQSQDEKQCFHGDLPQVQNLSSPEQFAKPWDVSTSSASDTDYESWDETAQSGRGEDLGLIEEGEATPTGNSNVSKHASHFRKRHRAPLGAVELKPYRHQVGGHSTVFHFSNRAVCKQLSNRENEFYEVLERRHPELLKFLPRYVLSVYAQRITID